MFQTVHESSADLEEFRRIRAEQDMAFEETLIGKRYRCSGLIPVPFLATCTNYVVTQVELKMLPKPDKGRRSVLLVALWIN